LVLPPYSLGWYHIEWDHRLCERPVAVALLECGEDGLAVHHAEMPAEAEQFWKEGAEHGGVVATLRDVAIPHRERHRLHLVRIVSERHARGVDAASAAADDEVEADPLALQHFPEAERGRALHAARADDEGDALSLRGAPAGKP